METIWHEEDRILLQEDRYTYAVLLRILEGECRLIRTDRKRLILCHSEDPFPVWIWVPADASAEEKEAAWQLAQELCPLKEGYRYNLRYELAEYFLQRAAEEGCPAEIYTNMYAYDCPFPKRPDPAEGSAVRAEEKDLQDVLQMEAAFHRELQLDERDWETYREILTNCIAGGMLWLWKDPAGKSVAMCRQHPVGEISTISGVFTLPEERRKHYAENLVWQMSCLIHEEGRMPMLYTDADYAASNACYEKIGYVLRGKLCTIGKKDDGHEEDTDRDRHAE